MSTTDNSAPAGKGKKSQAVLAGGDAVVMLLVLAAVVLVVTLVPGELAADEEANEWIADRHKDASVAMAGVYTKAPTGRRRLVFLLLAGLAAAGAWLLLPGDVSLIALGGIAGLVALSFVGRLASSRVGAGDDDKKNVYHLLSATPGTMSGRHQSHFLSGKAGYQESKAMGDRLDSNPFSRGEHAQLARRARDADFARSQAHDRAAAALAVEHAREDARHRDTMEGTWGVQQRQEEALRQEMAIAEAHRAERGFERTADSEWQRQQMLSFDEIGTKLNRAAKQRAVLARSADARKQGKGRDGERTRPGKKSRTRAKDRTVP